MDTFAGIAQQILAYREFTLGQWILIAAIVVSVYYTASSAAYLLRRRLRHRAVRRLRDEHGTLRQLKRMVL